MAKEIWDAYDREGNLLGFDLVRDEPMPEGAWHLVVIVIALTKDRRILVTQRHRSKPWGGYWEVTGGSVLKGETPIEGALRELREETGIIVTEADLQPFFVENREGIDTNPTIYHNFLAVFDPTQQTIKLQEGETVEYRLLPYEEFKRFIMTDEFAEPIRRRFLDHWDEYDRVITAHLGIFK